MHILEYEVLLNVNGFSGFLADSSPDPELISLNLYTLLTSEIFPENFNVLAINIYPLKSVHKLSI